MAIILPLFVKMTQLFHRRSYCCSSDYVSFREFLFLVSSYNKQNSLRYGFVSHWQRYENILYSMKLYLYISTWSALIYFLKSRSHTLWSFGTIYVYQYNADFEFASHSSSRIGSTHVMRCLIIIELRYFLIWLTFKRLATGIKPGTLLILLLSVLA
jgi:hypothetical protein